MKLNRNGCRIWMWETVGRKCKYYNHLWNSRSNSKINVKKRTIHLTYSTVACGIKNLSYEPDCLLRRILPLHVFWVLFCSAHLPLDLSCNMTCMLSPVSLSCGRPSWSGSPSEGPEWEFCCLVPFWYSPSSDGYLPSSETPLFQLFCI